MAAIRRLLAVTVVGLAAAAAPGLAGCGGHVSTNTQQDGAIGCQEDHDCPLGTVCSGGVCAAVDAGPAVDVPAPPAISVTPTVLTFGDPYVGGEYTQSFTIRNVGGSVLTVSQLQLLDTTQNHDFTLDGPVPPFTIVADPQAGVTVNVVLRPTDNLPPAGVVHVISDDPSTLDVPVQLTATVKDNASLTVCVLTGATPAAGCTVSPSDGSPLIDLGAVAYGGSAQRVVSLLNGGAGNVAEKIVAVRYVSSLPLTHYSLKLFTLDATGAEVVASFPYYLNPVDPSGQTTQNELRARVTLTANGVDGAISGASLEVDSDHPDGARTLVPIIGTIEHCVPVVADGGVAPDGGADPQTDPNNCGTCGHVCALPHATPVCQAGVCQVSACDTGWGDCDSAAPGCETDVTSSSSHCGACGHGCVNPNGSTGCANSQCTPVCNGGYSTCGGDPAQGCTVSLSSPGNCLVCGHRCTNDHGGQSCLTAAGCIPSCDPGFGDCDGNKDNGCETDLNGTTTSCGACGHGCAAVNGTTSCVGGQCVPVCNAGFSTCGADPALGCTVSLTTTTNCLTCGHHCTNDHGPPIPTICGAAGCVPTCLPNFGDCDGNPDNGCETDLSNGLGANCGACHHDCNNQHGSTGCSNGQCTPVCTGKWDVCGGDPALGCTVDLTTTANCGACGNACASTAANFPHVTSFTCDSGGCALVACAAGYFSFDDPHNSNGCECLDADLGNKACGSAANLGVLDDTGGSVLATGNLPFSGDEAWFSVAATNTHWDAAGGTNPYHVKIGFSANPGNQFQLQVFTSCSALAACPSGSQPIDQTIGTNLYEWSAAGEASCYNTSAPWPGVQVCQQHGGTFYIRVIRTAAASCDSFKVLVSNG